MIKLKAHGDFKKTSKWLEKASNNRRLHILEKYGELGLEALRLYTPKDTGKTASSWYYEVKYSENSASLSFFNSNINEGVPIAIILQYGHRTGNGGWVEGIDYINPALKPVFDKLAEEAWLGVTNG